MERIRVTAGIIINNDKVLITRRAPNENFAGGWEFPGGKIEADETLRNVLQESLKRSLI